MKSIALAAGYATRMYPLTEYYPKPLLEIEGNTILGRLLDDLDTVDEVDEHIIITNHRFAQIFTLWAHMRKGRKPVTILDDQTLTNETRLGAVNDLCLAINTFHLDDDLLVLAADNLLQFSLRGFVDAFHQKQTSMIMCHHESELSKLQRTGVIRVDDQMRVLQMQEKPQEPVSRWAVPPFYIYCRADLPLILSATANGCGTDAPGNLAHYIADHSTLHAWPMPAGRIDVGDIKVWNSLIGQADGKTGRPLICKKRKESPKSV